MMDFHKPADEPKRMEMFKLHRAMEERFLYYLVALSVAGIGFAINVTINDDYSHKLILVAITIVLWFSSASLGISAISKLVGITRKNFDLLGAFHLKDEIAGNGPDSIKQHMDTVLIPQLKKKSVWMKRCFVAGIITFIIWRVVDLFGK